MPPNFPDSLAARGGPMIYFWLIRPKRKSDVEPSGRSFVILIKKDWYAKASLFSFFLP